MADAINTGMILEALNDKVDRDCRNVDTNSGADVVIEWQAPDPNNDYKWYRLYKSGWIEQGGKTTSRDETVTFPKAFMDTNYTIVGNEIFDSPEAEYELSIVRTSTTQARLYCDYAGGSYSGNGACWIAKGMAATE